MEIKDHLSNRRNRTLDIEKLTQEQREEWEERAAIMEYDGGLPRAEAEEMAFEAVTRKRLNR